MINADICIVGAGVAGITVAREFIGQPFRVCLLESGGLVRDEETQSLARGNNIGFPYLSLETTRFRQFGGTLGGAAWYGQLDEIDFEQRDWIPYSGWPFAKSYLDPFYERAQRLLGLGSFADEVEIGAAKTWPALPFVTDRVITKIIQIGAPIHFGEIYRNDIEHAANIQTYLYGNVVDIETSPTAETVTSLRVVCLHGKELRVSARLYILAAGGIENARLLLLSAKTQQTGLGNQNDLVGRFFMEHPHVETGRFTPSDGDLFRILYRLYNVDNLSRIRALALAGRTQRSEKLLNFSATLELPHYQRATGTASFGLLTESIRQLKIAGNPVRHLSNLIFHLNDIGIAAYKKVVNTIRREARYFRFHNRVEQSPNPNSRVTLSEERDIFGYKGVSLDWQLSPSDRSSIRRANEIIRVELNQAGLGGLELALDDGPSWPPSLTGGHHHIGTTRMHVEAKRGVVNENCRLHGTRNLFLAGSSIFPTSGSANPTLTIVALSLRLADHVKALLKRSSV